MYRASACQHCSSAPPVVQCAQCSRPACERCAAECTLARATWTGACPTCATSFDDTARRALLAAGGGNIACSVCGSTRALIELARLDDAATVEYFASGARSCDACGERVQPRSMPALFVTIDAWEGPRNRQWIHHLLCRCGAVLASAGGRSWTHEDERAMPAVATGIGPIARPAPLVVTEIQSANVGVAGRLRTWLRDLLG